MEGQFSLQYRLRRSQQALPAQPAPQLRRSLPRALTDASGLRVGSSSEGNQCAQPAFTQVKARPRQRGENDREERIEYRTADPQVCRNRAAKISGEQDR